MWLPTSWRSFDAKHQPKYSTTTDLLNIERELSNSIPLVTLQEIEKLHYDLSQVAQEQAFILHCGDCAESLYITENDIQAYLQLLFNMESILQKAIKKPIVKMARIAGQFAKPRTCEFETRNGKILPSYCGDMINSVEFDEKSRKHNPHNLMKAYNKSASILNYIRAQLSIPLANSTSHENIYAEHLRPYAIDVNLYTSHEALVLNYEEALTRKVGDDYYNLSAHFLWVGNKTRTINQSHIEYISGINNPIAIKIDSNITADELLRIVDKVNPKNIVGKLTVISRMGMKKIENHLPNLIYRVKNEGKSIIWSCDPMHGNTELSASGYKVRYIDNIKSEIQSFIAINKLADNYPGGIHLELTAEDVYECLDDNSNLIDLKEKYCTRCDPRLNSAQAIDLMCFSAQELNKG